ncbi:MAG: hypothetical protein KGR48_02515 [Alphaproteobacteria bacterium]|nr:hypothetical protein [Alphaproteobacteria bacterium]MDE2014021.1 hypothetical protein [Alphaproteobacteria bacterium]
MGVARLLAKGWVVFCLCSGVYALAGDLAADIAPGAAVAGVVLVVLLFGAMGLLFIGGYAVATAGGSGPFLKRIKPHHILPGFNEVIFIVFVLAALSVQVLYLPDHLSGGLLQVLQAGIEFAVPGQVSLEFALGVCGLDGGRMFAAAFAWLLAFIYLGSALSRVRLAAGLVRLERKQRPEALGPTGLAALLGFVAVIGVQFLYVGSLFALLPCSVLRGITGDVLIGIVPLMLAYLIVAALTNLLALGPEA